MFKISELKNVLNEKINIETHKVMCEYLKTKEKTYYNTLSFEITGELDNNSFSLYIELNNDIKELLNYKKLEKININKYICESWFNFNDENGIEPDLNVYITRYLDNKFNVTVYFFTETNNSHSFEDKYSGLIEFDFNLDDYLGDANETN